AAAQYDGIARPECERGDVDSDVRSRLVDGADDTEGHGDLRELDAVVEGALIEHATHGVGKLGDVAHSVRQGAYARFVQSQTILQSGGETGLAASSEIGGVRGDDLSGGREDRVGDGDQCRALGVIVEEPDR